LLVQIGHSGIFSKFFIKSSKYAGKKAFKEGVQESGQKLFKQNLDDICKRFGDNLAYKIDNISFKSKIDKQKLVNEISRYGDIYKKSYFSEDAIIFGLKNKQAGRYLLNNFDYYDLKNSGLFNQNSKKIVRQLWRFGDDTAIGGSALKLKKALKNAEIKQTDCIPCKALFKKNDKYSKIKFNKAHKSDNPNSNFMVKKKKKATNKKRTTKYEKEIIDSGSKKKVAGKQTVQRDQIVDPKKKDAKGRTNCDRMSMDPPLAPVGPDGVEIRLHHHKQQNSGPIIEMTFSEHKNHKLHGFKHKSEIDRNEFNKWKRKYWHERANSLCR